MLGEHHDDLAQEFPEFKDRVHELKVSDPNFAKMYEEYQAVDKEVYRIEEQIDTSCSKAQKQGWAMCPTKSLPNWFAQIAQLSTAHTMPGTRPNIDAEAPV